MLKIFRSRKFRWNIFIFTEMLRMINRVHFCRRCISHKCTICQLYFDHRHWSFVQRFELTTQDRMYICTSTVWDWSLFDPVDNNSDRSNELGAAIGPQPWNTNSNLHFRGIHLDLSYLRSGPSWLMTIWRVRACPEDWTRSDLRRRGIIVKPYRYKWRSADH